MRPEAFRAPLTLHGRYVDLVPLELGHAAGLLAAGRDPEVSRFLLQAIGPGLPETEAAVRTLLAKRDAGTDLPFASISRATGEVVGMTRYIHIDPENDSVEIGGTFLDSRFWRSPLNTDAKLAQLRHAFEVGQAHRVWLQTDERNLRSQAAIARLGAVREGTLREDRRRTDGSYRSSVVFSIVASEWPSLRARLEAALQRPWPSGPTRASAG